MKLARLLLPLPLVKCANLEHRQLVNLGVDADREWEIRSIIGRQISIGIISHAKVSPWAAQAHDSGVRLS
jgi:hypothetical protein